MTRTHQRQSQWGDATRKEHGPYCKNCRQRVRWTKVVTKWEKDITDAGHFSWRVRFCPRCGAWLDEKRFRVDGATPRVLDFRNA